MVHVIFYEILIMASYNSPAMYSLKFLQNSTFIYCVTDRRMDEHAVFHQGVVASKNTNEREKKQKRLRVWSIA